MDPDICLSDIRALVKHADDMDDPLVEQYSFHQLVDLVDGLDAWMSSGGHPPRAWLPSSSPRGGTPQAEVELGQDEPEDDLWLGFGEPQCSACSTTKPICGEAR